jgi:hypothetical protein
MSVDTILENELVLIEPEPTQFLKAVGIALNDAASRAVRIVGADAQAVNFVEVVRLRYPDVDIATVEDASKISDEAIILTFETDGARLQEVLLSFVDASGITVIAPMTDWYFKHRPLYLITIPKAGTHLLYGLVEAFGYSNDVVTEAEPQPGGWYCLEYTNSHTVARDFFVDSVRRKPHGGRDHPFPWTPTLFLYRNPLDIAVSEANYYHRDGNTLFAPYLAGLEFEDRLIKLIDDRRALGTIRDRVGSFSAWLDCVNVVPLSFEEIVGSRGGGMDDVQKKLVWSLQLKLQVPGKPRTYAEKAFDPSSPTFESGQIGRHRESFTAAAWDAFNRLPQDFMEDFGYDTDEASNAMPSHAERFLYRAPRYLTPGSSDVPFIVERDGRYSIQKYRGLYYPATAKIGGNDLLQLDQESLGKLPSALTLEMARLIAFQNL